MAGPESLSSGNQANQVAAAAEGVCLLAFLEECIDGKTPGEVTGADNEILEAPTGDSWNSGPDKEIKSRRVACPRKGCGVNKIVDVFDITDPLSVHVVMRGGVRGAAPLASCVELVEAQASEAAEAEQVATTALPA